MARVETEGSDYSLLERIVYLFLIPVVFTAILTVVLLNLFGYNVMDSVLRAANKVPLLERVIPDPVEKTPALADPDNGGPTDVPLPAQDETISRLENDLSMEKAESALKDERIAALETQVDELQAQLEARTLDNEEYMQEIKRLAKVYEDMSASKAAPILEQLGTYDRMLILSQMNTDSQTKILARMNPAIAAETTLQQIDDLRVKLLDGTAVEAGAGFSREEIGRTISGMTPNSASLILLELAKSDEAKVIGILREMDVQSRSAVISAMAVESQEVAARLTAGLAREAFGE